eukprot:gene6368-10375_t
MKKLLLLLFFVQIVFSIESLNSSITSVYLGSETMFLFTSTGIIYVSGSNQNGKLGIGEMFTEDILVPTNLTTISNVTKMFSYNHTLFIKEGSIYGCGKNDFGQLGLGDTQNRFLPTKITGFTNVIQVTGGVDNSHFLLSNGTVFAFGRNFNNSMGLNDFRTSILYPEMIGITNAIEICDGHRHGKILTSSQEVYVFGSSKNFQLCDGQSTVDALIPKKLSTQTYSSISCGFLYSSYLLTNNSLLQTCGESQRGALGTGSILPLNRTLGFTTPVFENVTSVSSGYEHALFVTSNQQDSVSSVYSFGRASEGQLGLGGFTDQGSPTLIGKYSNIINLASGPFTSAILTKSKLLVFGKNSNGELGLGDKSIRISPEIVICNNGYSGNECEFVTCFGVNSTDPNVCSGHGTCNQPNICSCSAGYFGEKCHLHSCFGVISNDPKVCSGNGVCSSIDNCTCSEKHSGKECKTSYYGVGYNFYSMLSEDGSYDPALPSKIPVISNLKQIAIGSFFQVFVTYTDDLYAMGTSQYGELGLSTGYLTKPTLLMDNVKQVAVGEYHTLILKNDGYVYSMGYNLYGQLGLGNQIDTAIPTLIPALSNITQVSAGKFYSMALKNDGTVFAFGTNFDNQLGNATTGAQLTVPTQIPNLKNVTKIVTARSHCLALTSDSMVYSWGKNADGELGLGSATSYIIAPTKITSIQNVTDIAVGLVHSLFLQNGTVYACGNNDAGQLGNSSVVSKNEPTLISSLKNIVQISAGTEYSLAVNSSGNLFVFGSNNKGVLCLGSFDGIYSTPVLVNNTVNITKIYSNGITFMIDSDKNAYVCGISDHFFSSGYFSLSKIAASRRSATDEHLLGINADGDVYSIGNNQLGQLGDGTTKSSAKRKIVSVPLAKYVSSGDRFSLVLTQSGDVYSFGRGVDGQLGDGTGETRLSPVLISSLQNITQISTGTSHSLVLRSDGLVFGFGANNKGEIGTGILGKTTSPNATLVSNITQISTSSTHSLVLLDTGLVYAFGSNSNGELGNGTKGVGGVATPILINSVSNITFVQSVRQSSYLLHVNGTILSFGQNDYGRLGLGFQGQLILTPTAVQLSNIIKIFAGSYLAYAINNEGSLYAFGLNGQAQFSGFSDLSYSSPILIKSNINFSDISVANTRFSIFEAAGCKAGYSGANCEVVECFGKNSTDSTACTGNGVCNGINNCTCNYGHFGDECEIYQCFGVNSTDSNVCSGHGSCISPDNCTCLNNYNGSQCETFQCFGMNSTDSKVCSGNGNCSGHNTCSCKPNYSGNQCESFQCFGINSTDSIVCSGNGVCLSPNNCTCNGNLSGKDCSFTFYASGSNRYSIITEDGSQNPSVPQKIPGFSNMRDASLTENFMLSISENLEIYVLGFLQCDPISESRLYKTPTLISSFFNATDISVGFAHALLLRNDGMLFSFGNNENGELGDGTTNSTFVLIQIQNINSIVKISAGGTFSLVLKNDGNVYSFGSNTYGQLGDGTTIQRNTPTLITTVQNIIEISAGRSHSILLKSDSTVYSFGYNLFGQLGLGNNSNAFIPTKIPNVMNIKKVSAGHSHSLLLTNSGMVYSFGLNYDGQLGIGTYIFIINTPVLASQLTNIVEISAGEKHSVVMNGSSSIFTFGDNAAGELCLGDFNSVNVPTHVKNISDVTKLVQKGYSTMMMKNGEFYICGGSSSLMTDYLSFSKMSVADARIISGSTHSVVINHDNTVDTIGKNNFGQLGDGTTTTKTTKTRVSTKDVVQASSSNIHTLLLTKTGKVYGFGANNLGQLGDGTGFNRLSPTLIPTLDGIISASVDDHSIVLSKNGSVFGFGKNTRGELGDGTTTSRLSPVLVSLVSNVTQISVGSASSFVLTDSGSVYAFGKNDFGQLGIGPTNSTFSSIPVHISSVQNVIQISAGFSFTLLLTSNGYVYSFGRNIYGQLGNNFGNTSTNLPNVVPNLIASKISAGASASYVITQNQSLYAFGSNSVGQFTGYDEPFHTIPIQIKPELRFVDVISNRYFAVFSVAGCQSGYSGVDCSVFQCFGINRTESMVCSGNGNCTSSNFCQCDLNYNGAQCESFTCFEVNSTDPNVCSSHGNCTSFNNCTCMNGYTGIQCEVAPPQPSPSVSPITSPSVSPIASPTFKCFGLTPDQINACSGKGECISQDSCSCNPGFNGNQCQFLDSVKCFGLNANDTNACSSNGICSSNNNCTCNTNYYSTQCESYNCFEFSNTDSRVCSSKGSCLKPNNCTCLTGYIGFECESPVCFGFNSSNPEVCSKNGVCAGPDRCMCKEGFKGTMCEQNKTTPFIGDVQCAVFENEYIRYYHTENTFVIEPSICSKSGWAGFGLHTKDGIDYSMFLSFSYYLKNGEELKIGEIKNHRSLEVLKTPSIGLLLPKDLNFPEGNFINKQRYTVRVDDELIKNFDYISIVCGKTPPNDNLTFTKHDTITNRYFNISRSKSICDTFVLSGFSNRISDTSQDLWIIEMGVYIIILLIVLYFAIIAIIPSHLTCSTGKSFTIYALHLIVNIAFGIVLFTIGVFDVISNIIRYIRDVKRKTYKKNAWIKLLKLQTTDFYFTSDPYFFRLEQIVAFSIFILYFLFEMINFNVLIFGTENAFYFYFGKFFSTIGRSFVTYCFAFCQALLPLIVTILVLLFKTIKSFFNRNRPIVTLDALDRHLVDEQFFDIFLEFAQSEWSQENVLCYRDIQKFNRATKDKKADLAFNIYYIYLNGQNSPAEINIDSKTCAELYHQINDESCKFDSETFSLIMKAVRINIADTWSRFCLTDIFAKYEKNSEFQNVQLKYL